MKQVTTRSGRKISQGIYDPATDNVRLDRKGRVRYRIENEVTPGKQYDVFDLCADLAKRLNMVERGFMFLLADLKASGELPAIILDRYGDMVDTYVSSVMSGTYKARTDLAEDNFDTFTGLMERDAKVTQILEEEGY